MTTFERALRAALDEIGIAASDSQIERLAAHHALLERWNRRMNLTRITGAVEVARRHFGEAAFLHRELPPAASLVDVGSGAGFPGLPVAVLRPESLVTLVESKRRKAAFLRQASWDLPNVRVAACRIADWDWNGGLGAAQGRCPVPGSARSGGPGHTSGHSGNGPAC